MSRQGLADAVGVNYQTVGYLERGDYNPSLELAFRLSEVFGVPIEAIFSRQPFRPMSEELYSRDAAGGAAVIVASPPARRRFRRPRITPTRVAAALVLLLRPAVVTAELLLRDVAGGAYLVLVLVTVFVLRGVRAEPGTLAEPAHGPAWTGDRHGRGVRRAGGHARTGNPVGFGRPVGPLRGAHPAQHRAGPRDTTRRHRSRQHSRRAPGGAAQPRAPHRVRASVMLSARRRWCATPPRRRAAPG